MSKRSSTDWMDGTRRRRRLNSLLTNLDLDQPDARRRLCDLFYQWLLAAVDDADAPDDDHRGVPCTADDTRVDLFLLHLPPPAKRWCLDRLEHMATSLANSTSIAPPALLFHLMGDFINLYPSSSLAPGANDPTVASPASASHVPAQPSDAASAPSSAAHTPVQPPPVSSLATAPASNLPFCTVCNDAAALSSAPFRAPAAHPSYAPMQPPMAAPMAAPLPAQPFFNVAHHAPWWMHAYACTAPPPGQSRNTSQPADQPASQPASQPADAANPSTTTAASAGASVAGVASATAQQTLSSTPARRVRTAPEQNRSQVSAHCLDVSDAQESVAESDLSGCGSRVASPGEARRAHPASALLVERWSREPQSASPPASSYPTLAHLEPLPFLDAWDPQEYLASDSAEHDRAVSADAHDAESNVAESSSIESDSNDSGSNESDSSEPDSNESDAADHAHAGSQEEQAEQGAESDGSQSHIDESDSNGGLGAQASDVEGDAAEASRADSSHEQQAREDTSMTTPTRRATRSMNTTLHPPLAAATRRSLGGHLPRQPDARPTRTPAAMPPTPASAERRSKDGTLPRPLAAVKNNYRQKLQANQQPRINGKFTKPTAPADG